MSKYKIYAVGAQETGIAAEGNDLENLSIVGRLSTVWWIINEAGETVRRSCPNCSEALTEVRRNEPEQLLRCGACGCDFTVAYWDGFHEGYERGVQG